jgi:hypothetical protein
MKTTTSAIINPTMEFKNRTFVQEMIAKRQEKRKANKPISNFALKYGLIDNTGQKSKSRNISEQL